MGRVEQSCTRRPRKSESRREQGRTALPATTGGRDKVKTRPRQSQESARHESCDTGQGSGTSAGPIGRRDVAAWLLPTLCGKRTAVYYRKLLAHRARLASSGRLRFE